MERKKRKSSRLVPLRVSLLCSHALVFQQKKNSKDLNSEASALKETA